LSLSSLRLIYCLVFASGKSLCYCFGTYLRLKDEVFGELLPPYDPDPLEKFLQEVYGETTTMNEVDNWPRVAIAAVLADRWPAELHLFRNYSGPQEVSEAKDGDSEPEWSSEFL
jgi:calcium-independent phospholipase A2